MCVDDLSDDPICRRGSWIYTFCIGVDLRKGCAERMTASIGSITDDEININYLMSIDSCAGLRTYGCFEHEKKTQKIIVC